MSGGASHDAMSGDVSHDEVAFKVEIVINHSRKLEKDIKNLDFNVKDYKDLTENIRSQIEVVDQCIRDKQAKLGTAVEEDTIDQSFALEASATGQTSKLLLTEDVLGVVATLGKVNDDRLSRAISEFIGLENMLAIVCKSYEGVKAIENYDSERMSDLTAGLHGHRLVSSNQRNGRFLVYCLRKLRPYTGEFMPEDPQKRLNLEKPVLANGESPPGFLGFAVNLIYLDRAHISCLRTGEGLRETLFFNLLSFLQVYETREQLHSALPWITHGAVSLDGGIIKMDGLFTIGDRNNLDVKFPVRSRTDVILEEELKLMKSKKRDLVEDLSKDQTLLNKLQDLLTKKTQQLSNLLDCVTESQKEDEEDSILNFFLTERFCL